MAPQLKIGLVGLDTSHVIAFSQILNNSDHPHHIRGAEIVAGYPGAAEDFALSRDRVEGFTRELREDFGVQIVDSPEEVAARVDLLFISSVDGRAHRSFLERTASSGKPTFIDKPFALTAADAEAMLSLAAREQLPLMSCSSLRYSEPFQEALGDESLGALVAVDAFGPMALEPTQPGWFWYGCHAVEMVTAAMGPGCCRVQGFRNDDFDALIAEWEDGRVAAVRGLRRGHHSFGVTLHREQGPRFVDASAGRPPYAGMLEAILGSLPHGRSAVPAEEMLQCVRLMEAGNRSRESGQAVEL